MIKMCSWLLMLIKKLIMHENPHRSMIRVCWTACGNGRVAWRPRALHHAQQRIFATGGCNARGKFFARALHPWNWFSVFWAVGCNARGTCATRALHATVWIFGFLKNWFFQNYLIKIKFFLDFYLILKIRFSNLNSN